ARAVDDRPPRALAGGVRDRHVVRPDDAELDDREEQDEQDVRHDRELDERLATRRAARTDAIDSGHKAHHVGGPRSWRPSDGGSGSGRRTNPETPRAPVAPGPSSAEECTP